MAYAQNIVQLLPVKEKKIEPKTRWLSYVYVYTDDEVLISRRTEDDIWKGLYEFSLVESSEELSLASLQHLFPQGQWTMLRQGLVHQLTHQRLLVNFYLLKLPKKDTSLHGHWVKKAELQNYTFPQLLIKLLSHTDNKDFQP
jgi:A/G-specific adenine glycosylase